MLKRVAANPSPAQLVAEFTLTCMGWKIDDVGSGVRGQRRTYVLPRNQTRYRRSSRVVVYSNGNSSYTRHYADSWHKFRTFDEALVRILADMEKYGELLGAGNDASNR